MFGRKVDIVGRKLTIDGRKQIKMVGNLYKLVGNASYLIENQLNPTAITLYPLTVNQFFQRCSMVLSLLTRVSL
jgi:hypothetical protein